MVSEKKFNNKLSGPQNSKMVVMLIVKAISCLSLGMLFREKDFKTSVDSLFNDKITFHVMKFCIMSN